MGKLGSTSNVKIVAINHEWIYIHRFCKLRVWNLRAKTKSVLTRSYIKPPNKHGFPKTTNFKS
jgi:hypothetical protein